MSTHCGALRHPFPIHLIVPMSGQGARYQKVGYTEPKPLIPISNVPMIERLLSNFPDSWPTHFVLAENHRATALVPLLEKLRPQANKTFIPPHSKGPSFAALAALKEIPPEAPVFLSYCDYGMVWDPMQFLRFVKATDCDACVVSYRGFHAHYLNPVTYAYCRLDGERVVEVKEKGSFTDNRENEFASAGGYYFRTAKLLNEAIEYQMQHQIELNGEYYTSLTVEALLRKNPQAHVRVFEIPGFFQWGTPQDLRNFEFWEKSYQSHNRYQRHRSEVSQVLMPMAGLGSRFQSISSLPKPLIPVDREPMFLQALASLPAAKRTVLVALDSFSKQVKGTAPQAHVVSLKETPMGQALSTEHGISSLHETGDIVVSSCDHAVALNPSKMAEFRSSPDCDAAIFTITGFPGCDRRPNAYAYVVPETSSDLFPRVKRVSVKEPVSEHPSDDALLVGTFWFRDKAILAKGIQLLKETKTLVNGECYLDSVFGVLQQHGHTVRMIPLDGYLCWGDPDSLCEALYWQEVFCGHRISQRPRFPGVGQ